MRKHLGAVALIGALLASTTLVHADNLDKLGNMQTTGAKPDIPLVPQTGAEADAIKKTLTQIKLPEGFHIALYALVPDARHIAVGPQGVVTFVGTRKSKVWAVTDRGRKGVADEVKEFAPSIAKTLPNGVCFSKDGMLYIAEQNRILQFAAAEFFYESPDVAVNTVVPEGQLIPKDAESYNHTARVCRVGPDNKLYVTLGQPFNIPPADRLAEFTKAGVGSITRMDQDGKNREIYANGIRNSVGLDFSPKDKSLWFTDNQVDGMGDDIPPGEIDHATKMGQNFGFPWYGGGHIRTNEYKKDTPPADVVFPVVETVAHAADLGMSFYTGKMFPKQYQGAIFSAQHGSWNRTVPVGARVMVTTIKDDGTATTEPFAEGWLDQDGQYNGRPVDVEQMRDGSLLVSDDLAGALYRITYDGK
jgi:glucose/arabinose dehydrogenase